MESNTITSTYTMLIADDHPLIRNSLTHMIKRLYPEFDVLTTNTAIRTAEILKTKPVDFILLDVMLDDGISLGNIEKLKKLRPALKILVISQYSTESFGEKAIKLGADGYVEKKALISEIVKAINTVLDDEIYLKEEALYNLVFKSNRQKLSPNPFDQLSKKELEVAFALIKGKSRDEIAIELDIKLNTVSMHKARVFEKLKVTGVLALRELAQNNNLI